MNKDPKMVYILKNGSYNEITYEQFCQIRSTDEEYKKSLLVIAHTVGG